MDSKKRIPWNKDRKVSERIAFEQDHLLALQKIFIDGGETHDLALFMVGIDTLLRVSDLLRLRVRDLVKPDGTIRASFPWQQQKTDHTVHPILTPSATEALLVWVGSVFLVMQCAYVIFAAFKQHYTHVT